MTVQLCPRCQHPNPRDAAFCHFDGHLLRPGAAPASTFPREFVFPSGRRCRTFDELASGVYYEWEDARELLRDGSFTSFLAGMGRADLARAAREAQTLPDIDIALTTFVASLPAPLTQGPKLGLNPRRLAIGPVPVGEKRPVLLQITNDGRGVLQGKITVAEGGAWLTLAGDSDPETCPIHAPREQTLELQIDTAGLVVGRGYAAKLVVVTNGGVAEVPLRLELTARPFSRPPYHGAATPHELAKRMRDQPHPAVAMFQSGEVARWFASNGWAYPIAGEPASGLAAVQQFFEELGLARAPKVVISHETFDLACRPPDVRHEQVVVTSAARKLVYARAESAAAWLQVTTPNVSGQARAAIDFTIDSSLMTEDRLWEAELKVVANAGQTFHVRVRVQVQGSTRSRTTKVVPASPPAAARPPLSLGRAVVVGAFAGLMARLAMVGPADVYARWLASAAPDAGSLAAWLTAPAADGGFLRQVALATWWLGAILGGTLAWRGGGRWVDIACGVLAGAVAGLAGGATLGCALVVGDAPARALLRALAGGQSLGPAAAVPLWLAASLLTWTLFGALAALLLRLTRRRTSP